MKDRQVNHELALEILWEIHAGRNAIEELDETFAKEPDFNNTLSALSMESNPDGMIELSRPEYVYIIKGTNSGVWNIDLHRFLQEHGYKSRIGVCS